MPCEHQPGRTANPCRISTRKKFGFSWSRKEAYRLLSWAEWQLSPLDFPAPPTHNGLDNHRHTDYFAGVVASSNFTKQWRNMHGFVRLGRCQEQNTVVEGSNQALLQGVQLAQTKSVLGRCLSPWYMHWWRFPGEIPAGTRVPGWAYLDVRVRNILNSVILAHYPVGIQANDAFDVNLAEANASRQRPSLWTWQILIGVSTDNTESAAPQLTTSPSSTSSLRHSSTSSVRTSSTSSAAPSPISTSAPTNASSSSTTSDNSHRIDQIIGGTIGGVFALGILGFIWLYFFRKRRDSVGQQQLESQTSSQEKVDIPEMKGPSVRRTSMGPDCIMFLTILQTPGSSDRRLAGYRR
ncbi:hypothetical protein IMY05_C4703000400 [Salix suchowensis]|nr:hypothetical protein IMY05_C4703000400 [Salix suchowensis]